MILGFRDQATPCSGADKSRVSSLTKKNNKAPVSSLTKR